MDYFYKLKKQDISFVTTLIESFEGVGAVRTPNPKPGEFAILHAIVSPDFKKLFGKIIADIGRKALLERVKDEALTSK